MRIYSAITLLSVLFVAAGTDNRTGKIPNCLILTGYVLAVFCRWIEPVNIPSHASAVGLAILFAALCLYSAGKLGGGDVKLILLILVLFPGYEGAGLLWLAMLFSAAGGICGWIRFGSRRVRLGPGMFLGAVAYITGRFLP